jgi:hypothetical protein
MGEVKRFKVNGHTFDGPLVREVGTAGRGYPTAGRVGAPAQAPFTAYPYLSGARPPGCLG